MPSQLRGPFSGDVKAPPSPTSMPPAKNTQADCVNKPEDTSVLHTVFFQKTDALHDPSPAALASPMGTAIPGIGKQVK
jgi:hypothetical protein